MNLKTKLKEVIDTLKQGHCTKAFARDETGYSFLNVAEIVSDRAKSFCVSGACIRLEKDSIKGWDLAYQYYDMVRAKDPTKPVKLTVWNDEHTDEVIPTLENLYNELDDTLEH